MYTADIYLTWQDKWSFRHPIAAPSATVAQNIAEAIALAYGARCDRPDRFVYALKETA